jgi:hypothetical protein
MLIAAYVVLGIAVLLGSALAVLHLRTDGAVAPPWRLAALHGLVAVAGLGCLLLALQGPPRGLDHGTAAFGTIAAVLVAAAALLGAGFAVARLRGRPPAGLLIVVHATLAVGGFVILTAYIFAG